MTWLVLGILSVFWDASIGSYIPLLPFYVFGFYWKEHSPLIAAVVLYMHHVMSSSSGYWEIVILATMLLITSVDDLFYSKIWPYSFLMAVTTLVMFVEYGAVAAVVGAVEGVLTALWRRAP